MQASREPKPETLVWGRTDSGASSVVTCPRSDGHMYAHMEIAVFLAGYSKAVEEEEGEERR